jgi:hypothetical protein
MIIDYTLSHRKYLAEHSGVGIVVQDFAVPVGGELSLVTLGGETHLHTQRERQLLMRLAQERELILLEGGGESSNTLAKELYLTSVGTMYLPWMISYSLGSGRSFTHAFTHVPKERIEQQTRGGYDAISLRTKLGLVKASVCSLLIAPAVYWVGKSGSLQPRPSAKEVTHSPYRGVDVILGFPDEVVTERDGPMVKETLDHLKNHPGKTALVEVGLAHFPGMRKLLLAYGAKPLNEPQYLDDYLQNKK